LTYQFFRSDRQAGVYYSGETRWFFRGGIPENVASWFGAQDAGRFEPERTDHYLEIPSCRTLGVKIRNGRLELKALVGSWGECNFADTVTGFRETWVKWSSGSGSERGIRELVTNPDDRWILVRKKRCLRRFSLENCEVKEMPAAEAQVVPGCHVELTAVHVIASGEGFSPREPAAWGRTERWWSLSLESFGEPESSLGNLDRAAEYFFQDPPPMPLLAACSLSYPAWLAEFQSAAQAAR
jgi:hypothetical protein